MPAVALPAFAAYGIELEYMIVDRRSLDVRPLAPELLVNMHGEPVATSMRGHLGWSNELVEHVIEIKNLEPDEDLATLAAGLQSEIGEINRLLAVHDARLMPGGMHPWMDPARETHLWTRSDDAIYRAFDRTFGCRRHGWSNLQSMHVNLPFAGDAEFGRLHAAVRCVLPLIPALAASSPIADGERKAALDYRLEVYRSNAEPFRSIAGDVVPEAVATRDEYETRVLAPMYREIAPHDPQHVLQHEWLNSRGAIARFDRSTIEIRLADTQECPAADLAIAAATVAAVKALYEERWASLAALRAMKTDTLVRVLASCIRDADEAIIEHGDYLRVFGVSRSSCRAGDVWRQIVDIAAKEPGLSWCHGAWQMLLREGPLARRIARAIDANTSREHLREVYRRLCECLASGTLFAPR